MDPATAGAGTPPATVDLQQAMVLLGIADDPGYLMKDLPDAGQRAELLARIAAWSALHVAHAERRADLSIDDRADLHWAADLDIAGPSRRSLDPQRLFDLQTGRLAWVHHAVTRARGHQLHLLADTVSTAIGAVIQLLDVWRDGFAAGDTLDDPGPGREVDPMLTDSLLAFRGAADRVTLTLRSGPRPD
jgi:hypothetical protein